MPNPTKEEQARRPRPVRGLVSPAADGTRVRTAFEVPPPGLADIVEVFWRGQWDFSREDGVPPDGHTTKLISDPSVNIVFERNESSVSGRVVGVWTRLWTRTLTGRGTVRGAKLKPGACRAVIDRPAHTLSNRLVDLATLPHLAPPHLAASILDPRDDGDGFSAFSAWLSKTRPTVEVDGIREDVSLASAIVTRIREDATIVAVDELSLASGLAKRPLQRLFREFVGATPKWVIRRYRLQEAAERIAGGHAPNLAALAADLGYVDQAHLARDFKNVVGHSPSAFRRSLSI